MPNPNNNDQVTNPRSAPESKPLNQGKMFGKNVPSFGSTLPKLEEKDLPFPPMSDQGKFQDLDN